MIAEVRAVRHALTGAVAALLAAGLASGCSAYANANATRPTLYTQNLLGTWAGSGGSSITFTSASAFTATGIDLGAGCGVVSGSGDWILIDADGKGPVSNGDPNAIEVGLFFKKVSPAGGCLGGLQLSSWQTGSSPQLCVQEQPSTPCNGDLYSKR
jgi:hypothetical protein